jgi:hypothetical protein
MAKATRKYAGRRRRRGHEDTETMTASARGDIDHEAAHGTESAVIDIETAHDHATSAETTTTEMIVAGIDREVVSTDAEKTALSDDEKEAQVTSGRDRVRGTADGDGTEAGRRTRRSRREGTEHSRPLSVKYRSP